MGGYFGTETQQRLQAKVEARGDFIRTSPGACESGRFMSCDNIDRLGWDRILEFLESDGVFGFRFLPADGVAALRDRLAGYGYRFDTWDIFVADAATALAASDAILSAGLPDGLMEIEGPRDPDDAYIRSFSTAERLSLSALASAIAMWARSSVALRSSASKNSHGLL
jgi:hypothetical protein